MPIYELRCQQCGMVSEIFVRSADQEVRCPYCGGSSMERLISSTYMIKSSAEVPGTTCCGREERCETPPCVTGEGCRRQ